jgi:hypothetical protein
MTPGLVSAVRVEAANEPVSDTSRLARLALIHSPDSLLETVGTVRFALSPGRIEVFQIMGSAAGAEHPEDRG